MVDTFRLIAIWTLIVWAIGVPATFVFLARYSRRFPIRRPRWTDDPIVCSLLALCWPGVITGIVINRGSRYFVMFVEWVWLLVGGRKF